MRDHLGDKRIRDGQRYSDRRAGARNRLDGQRVTDVVLPQPAIRDGNRHAQQALVGSCVNHIGREFTRFVDAGGALRDNLAGESFDILLEGFLFDREL